MRQNVGGLLALYACVLSGHQGAIMAPTEILARQHAVSLKKLFAGLPIKIDVLCSSLPAAKKKEVLQAMKDGTLHLVAGTHALFQKEVEFAKLGLVVADEQHRFGVQQRKALKEKGEKVDFLLMSATPIPRTMAATLYGDMDISTIMTM
ncbi:MAG: DEAD/DEAH box helicase, partial [Holdemania massiliensis]